MPCKMVSITLGRHLDSAVELQYSNLDINASVLSELKKMVAVWIAIMYHCLHFGLMFVGGVSWVEYSLRSLLPVLTLTNSSQQQSVHSKKVYRYSILHLSPLDAMPSKVRDKPSLEGHSLVGHSLEGHLLGHSFNP